MMNFVWFLAFMTVGGWAAAALLCWLYVMAVMDNLSLRWRMRASQARRPASDPSAQDAASRYCQT